MNKYDDLIGAYKVSKEKYESLKTQLAEKQEEFNRLNVDLIDDVDLYKQVAYVAEEALRSKIKLDAEFGKEVFPEGLGVRKMTTYNYDSKQAFEWAKQSGLCLSLDTKAFKDICKSDNNRPEFVEVGFEYSPTISKNL